MNATIFTLGVLLFAVAALSLISLWLKMKVDQLFDELDEVSHDFGELVRELSLLQDELDGVMSSVVEQATPVHLLAFEARRDATLL